MVKSKLSVRDLCLIGLSTALIAIMAQISIPMPFGVPFTMQTFAVLLTGIALGAKKGMLSTIVYVILGICGVPVFSRFTGGIGVVFGMTGGFILSFPIMALIAGIGGSKNSLLWRVAGLIAAVVVNILCGMFWFAMVVPSSLDAAFSACVLPFIPTDTIKIIAVAVLSNQIKRVLPAR